jgi:heme/copper-type cytochrome/quinol oxidase subunit 2
MVFVEFLNPGCYSQLYMVESRLKALKCGIYEGIYWSIFVSIFLTIAAFRMIFGNRRLDIEPSVIKKYALIIICIIFIMFVTFFSLGYVNKWNSYQDLIQKYKKQGLREYEIFYLLEMEIGKSSAPIASAVAASSGLLFLGPKGERKEEGSSTRKKGEEKKVLNNEK